MPIDMYSVWLLLTTLTGSIIIIVLTIFRCVAHTSTQRHDTPKGIMNLLGPSTSVRGLLKSRSLANQRLRHTFNITNTFVQADTQTHNIFVGRMKDLLRVQSRHGQWGGFLRIARQAVASELNRYTIGQEFSTAFADLVQIVTLKAIVVSLLDPDRDMESIDAQDLCASATLITELWAMSKQQTSVSSAASSPSTCTPPDVDRLATLSTHLRRLLPDTERYPNPIDFVVPTWETLWRLVATSLAHVYDNKDYRHNFHELLGDPTPGRFRTTSLDSNLCTEWIINETLRLHPPSRHISRSFPLVKEHKGLQILVSLLPKFIRDHLRLDSIIRSEIADIESVHLSTDIWGPDALEFKPRRWERHAGAADSAPTLFAFGYGPLMCIGKSWAPMTAALIVGAILEGIDAERLEIIGTAVIGGRAGWAGWEFKHS
ncbi:hypothetical protein F5890DRAFT_1540360 [Lentinula detonsa]|uniref:Cytochrome P450 n=1 Tax=Lentinula detonsa TaxID=2804962 RepID=A0AA38PSU0_9AGAR|nr:hypothetical protein F5890DRAFT_1540360 [Lentinula detonsa]